MSQTEYNQRIAKQRLSLYSSTASALLSYNGNILHNINTIMHQDMLKLGRCNQYIAMKEGTWDDEEQNELEKA